MHLDVLDLHAFYYRSALGRAAQRAVRESLIGLWPEAKGQTVVGFGFAVPLLRPFLSDARRVVGLMPGPQGVMPWPAEGPNVCTLSEDIMWPLPTGLVDKLVVMHGLETSDHPDELLDEAWRVLGPGGRAVFIVPNRAGLWSRSDRTPFGFGRPFTLGQLEAQLKRHRFVPERAQGALFQPPSTRKVWRKSSRLVEAMGQRMPMFISSGVIMVEVSKQVAAPRRPGLPEAIRRPLKVLDPAPASAAKGIAGRVVPANGTKSAK